MVKRITDIHMHIVPKVDDGAVDLSMSLDMLKMAYEQGVRNIFCTSHNVYEEEEIKRYKANFMTLQMVAQSKYPNLSLHMGCELLCAGEYIEDILYGLEIGVFLPLGNSKCVLTELYPDATPNEAEHIVKSMLDAGWKPILAHTERYPNLFDDKTIPYLIALGTMIQVNLYSLEEEQDEQLKERARWLVENQYAHFVGSDAHRSNHRPPKYEKGIQYLSDHCQQEYLTNLCYNISDKVLLKMSKEEIKKRLAGRAAEYLMFQDD